MCPPSFLYLFYGTHLHHTILFGPDFLERPLSFAFIQPRFKKKKGSGAELNYLALSWVRKMLWA